MVKLSFWARCLGVGLLILLRVEAASVTASFDRGIVESGETVRFNVTLEGEQPTEVPKLPSLPLVQAIQYLGPRQMTQIINGVSSFQVVFQFQLQTRGQGELTMPSLAVTTRGGAFQTPSVSCRITPKEAKGERVSLKLVTPRDECYVGETLPYDLQLYSSVNLNQIAPPKMSFDGFVTGQEVPPSNTQTVRDGQAFIVLSYRQTATPTKEGLLSLGPATQEYVLEVNRGRRAELEKGIAEAPARQIRVKPLPVEGRPAGFSGAIGRFSVRTSVSRTNVAAGEAITVKWSVYGRGSFNSVQSPQLSLSDGLKTYPGTNGFTAEDPLGLAGTKTFESMVILESPSIKALTFEPYSFFDPDTGRYSTVTPRPIAVTVRPESGTSASTPTPPAVSVAPTSRFPDRRDELMSLSLRGGRRVPAELPWARQPLWLILAVLPLLGLGSLEGWRRWRELQQRRLQPTQASRMREAVRSQQAAMRAAAQGGRSEEFFAALDALLRVRCALILGLPSGDAITAQVIDEALVPKGLKAESAETLRGLFASVDAAKFSSAAESTELTQLQAQADATLEALQALEGGIR